MGLSNLYADNVLNDLYRDDPVFLALYTSDPTGADTGTEVSGGSYARVPITFSAPATETGKRTIKNNTEIQFPVATAGWGTVTHIGIRTAATGGDLISSVALNAPRTILEGDRAVFLVNNGVIRLS